jgi:hypothetical protein
VGEGDAAVEEFGGFMFGFVRFARNEAAKHRRWHTFLAGGNSLSKLIRPTTLTDR